MPTEFIYLHFFFLAKLIGHWAECLEMEGPDLTSCTGAVGQNSLSLTKGNFVVVTSLENTGGAV